MFMRLYAAIHRSGAGLCFTYFFLAKISSNFLRLALRIPPAVLASYLKSFSEDVGGIPLRGWVVDGDRSAFQIMGQKGIF